MANQRVTDAAVASALRQSLGKVDPAAKQLGISRQALHQRLAKKPLLSPKTDRKAMDQTVQHMQTVMLCAEFGETWAAKRLLKLSGWGQEKKPRPKLNFTDEEIAEIFDAMGSDLIVYDYYKERFAKERKKHSLFGRRRIIECAAAKALNIIPKEVWPKFRLEWVKLQNYKNAVERLNAKEAASNENTESQLSTVHGVELQKLAECQEVRELVQSLRDLDKVIGKPIELDVSGFKLDPINGGERLFEAQPSLDLDNFITPLPTNFGLSGEAGENSRSKSKMRKKSKRGDHSARS